MLTFVDFLNVVDPVEIRWPTINRCKGMAWHLRRTDPTGTEESSGSSHMTLPRPPLGSWCSDCSGLIWTDLNVTCRDWLLWPVAGAELTTFQGIPPQLQSPVGKASRFQGVPKAQVSRQIPEMEPPSQDHQAPGLPSESNCLIIWQDRKTKLTGEFKSRNVMPQSCWSRTCPSSKIKEPCASDYDHHLSG